MFVGRSKELSILHKAISEARSGQGGCVLIEGQPGLGRSTLVERAAQSLDGFTIFKGTSQDNDVIPFSLINRSTVNSDLASLEFEKRNVHFDGLFPGHTLD